LTLRGIAPHMGSYPPPFPPSGVYGVPGIGPGFAPIFGSVGAVIDAVRNFSDEDWQTFCQTFGLVPSTGASSSAVVPPGYTRDPATGRVFRLVAPRDRAAEYSRLQEALASARQVLAAHSHQLGAIRVEGGTATARTVTYTLLAGVSAADRAENVRLTLAFEAAKAAERAYRAAHPEEFRAPTRGRGRGRGNSRGRGTPGNRGRA